MGSQEIIEPTLRNVPQLANFDFDGTQFLTSETTAEGIDVNQAYFLSIQRHIGEEAARKFSQDGGHDHRPPNQIVQAVAVSMNENELESLSGRVTNTKLEILTDQIGKPTTAGHPWPRPSDGFIETWEKIYDAKNQQTPIGTSVISAGHTLFEQKVFDLWKLPQPDMYLTADLVEALSIDLPMEDQVKPAPMLVRIAQELWIYKLQRTQEAFKRLNLLPNLLRTVHVGDSLEKDGQLAINCDVEFIELSEKNSLEAWKKLDKFLGLGIGEVKNGI